MNFRIEFLINSKLKKLKIYIILLFYVINNFVIYIQLNIIPQAPTYTQINILYLN